MHNQTWTRTRTTTIDHVSANVYTKTSTNDPAVTYAVSRTPNGRRWQAWGSGRCLTLSAKTMAEAVAAVYADERETAHAAASDAKAAGDRLTAAFDAAWTRVVAAQADLDAEERVAREGAAILKTGTVDLATALRWEAMLTGEESGVFEYDPAADTFVQIPL